MRSRFLMPELRIRPAPIAAAVCILSLLCGCVARRGADFGHWAMRAERINTMRVFVSEDAGNWTGNERILVLPPTGRMPEDNRRQLHNNMRQEMLNYFSAMIYTLNRDERMSAYVEADNLMLTDDRFNLQEAGRIGKLLDATHVICILVREFRPYHPQVLALGIVMVETESFTAVAKMDAIFDASQQEVVLAADRYMQARVAREYNAENLDLMLRSPAQYSAFVAASCCRVLAHAMYENRARLTRNSQNQDLRNDGDKPIQRRGGEQS